MDKTTKTKLIKGVRQANVLESLKDLGVDTVKKETRAISQEFLNQLMGRVPEKKYSGELTVGESVEIDAVYSGRQQKEEKLKKQVTFERRLHEEEITLVEKKLNELRLRLHVVMQEVTAIAKATPKLAEEMKIATMQATVNPGEYHITFFEKLAEFLRNFSQGIENSITWLSATNKKAQKKTFWGLYKQYKGKFLLSGEHFSQRSAG